MEQVNLAEKFNSFHDYWSPKIVGKINDSYVKVAKLKEEFVWHQHETEDKLFLVMKNKLLIKLQDQKIWLEAGKLAIIPKGVKHLPVAEEEAHVMLLKPKSTVNTGNVQNKRTIANQ